MFLLPESLPRGLFFRFFSVSSFLPFFPFRFRSVFISLCSSSTCLCLFRARSTLPSLPGQLLTGHPMLLFPYILQPFSKVWHAALCVKHSNGNGNPPGNTPETGQDSSCIFDFHADFLLGMPVQIADTYLIWIVSGVFGCLRNDFRPFHPASRRRKPFKSLKLPNPAFLVPIGIAGRRNSIAFSASLKIHIFADGMPSCIQAVHGLLCQRFSSQAVLSDHHLSSKSRGWSWDSDFRCFSQVNSIEEYPMQPTKSQEHVWHARILCKPAFAKDSSSCFLSGCCKPQKVVVKNVGREATQTKHNTHASKDVQIWSTATSFLIKSSSSGWNCKWL